MSRLERICSALDALELPYDVCEDGARVYVLNVLPEPLASLPSPLRNYAYSLVVSVDAHSTLPEPLVQFCAGGNVSVPVSHSEVSARALRALTELSYHLDPRLRVDIAPRCGVVWLSYVDAVPTGGWQRQCWLLATLLGLVALDATVVVPLVRDARRGCLRSVRVYLQDFSACWRALTDGVCRAVRNGFVSKQLMEVEDV